MISDLVWIDATGYNYEDYPAFLAFFTTSYQNIYGPDAYLGPDSQDGQRIAVEAQAAYDTAESGAAIYNSFAPPTAQGVGLSRLVKINGIQRLVPTFSTALLAIGGTNGTVITNGIAVDQLNQQWNLPATVTIPSGGTINVTATAQFPGAVVALEGTIDQIFTTTQGWQTVTNAASATVGNPIESDAALRLRQAISTAIGSQTVLGATIAAVANVPGVTAIRGYENATGSVDGNGLPAHSIAIVVQGGTDIAIAQAIQVKKTPGTQTDGTTSVATVDSGGMPLVINFYRPTEITIGVQVTLVELLGWDNSTQAAIQDSVAEAVVAVPIGGTEVITALYMPAYLIDQAGFGTFNISGIELALAASGTITFTGNPANTNTLGINGTTIEFVSGTPTGLEVQILSTDLLTVASLLAFLQASEDVNLSQCQYSLDSTGLVITVTAIVAGPAGDSFEFNKTASNVTLNPSGGTLSGGAYGTSNIELLFNEIPVCTAATDVVIVT